MPKLTCKFCKKQSPFNDNEDVWKCFLCGFEQPTGYESKIRREIEAIR